MAKDQIPTPAQAIAEATARRTAAERAIAEAETPLLQAAYDVLTGPEAQALEAKLKPIVEALSGGNTASQMKHLLTFFDGARQAVPLDLATHRRLLLK